jgi:hypothetical protein
MAGKIPINRAPVLTLWAAVVAEQAGFDEAAALTLGQALAALNAQSKGRRLGIYDEKKETAQSKKKDKAPLRSVTLLGREIPIVKTPRGVRAAVGGQAAKPESVRTYLDKRFGEHLDEARSALEDLARAFTPAQLETRGFSLYEKFRPQIPRGKRGWGAKGELDLALVRRLAK